ncbi:MAG TPA: TonB-dependent receptor plug domain-containing protein [Chitinophagaceae bacterium]|nr:TonB-dependent receptor plug domain-containing protein [Chitinophagaceae bacterium]
MKRICITLLWMVTGYFLFGQVSKDSTNQQSAAKDSFYNLSPVEVRAVRANDRAPVTKTNISKKEIEKQNLGHDLPFLLNQTPSVVINSDAGNGVGYTGIRIRGTDASRINVTLNGIPYNDAESQGTFFVDLPDIASSLSSIQIQRGVGSSSNGAGAFGATINLSTNEINRKAYAEFNNSFGSFNTWKNTLKAGSGLIGNHFTADIRLSNITSDGYIDRASSRLRSLYFSTAYIDQSNTLRFNIIKGYEKTYQAWYGVSEADLKAGNRTINYAGTEKPGEPYDNETDNYWQDHYQLFYTHNFNSHLDFNTALFFTKGKGYYEEYRADQPYDTYHLPYPVVGADTIYSSDFIRQLWLNNNFYGDIFSLQYHNTKTEFTVGGAYTRYEGNHYGKLVWAEHGITGPDIYYDHDAFKNDFNSYAKLLHRISNDWRVYADLQYRHVKYDINGFEDNPDLLIKNNYDFFNPKVGLSYNHNEWSGYFSCSIANKEPNRDDFEAGQSQQPKPEHLNDMELGIIRKSLTYNWGATLYYMKYRDQLVLTGKINDVGAYTRTNIPDSYRMGIELQGGIQPATWFNASANLTLSSNKVQHFTEYIDDYDNNNQKLNNYSSTDIALSPGTTGATTLSFFPAKNFEINLLSKYVSKQYLDNTKNEGRKLDPYFVQDAKVIYTFHKNFLKEVNVILQVNNMFSEKYEPNGYTYNYISGGELVVNNYYFPMAGTNFMVGVNLRF